MTLNTHYVQMIISNHTRRLLIMHQSFSNYESFTEAIYESLFKNLKRIKFLFNYNLLL